MAGALDAGSQNRGFPDLGPCQQTGSHTRDGGGANGGDRTGVKQSQRLTRLPVEKEYGSLMGIEIRAMVPRKIRSRS